MTDEPTPATEPTEPAESVTPIRIALTLVVLAKDSPIIGAEPEVTLSCHIASKNPVEIHLAGQAVIECGNEILAGLNRRLVTPN